MNEKDIDELQEKLQCSDLMCITRNDGSVTIMADWDDGGFAKARLSADEAAAPNINKILSNLLPQSKVYEGDL